MRVFHNSIANLPYFVILAKNKQGLVTYIRFSEVFEFVLFIRIYVIHLFICIVLFFLFFSIFLLVFGDFDRSSRIWFICLVVVLNFLHFRGLHFLSEGFGRFGIQIFKFWNAFFLLDLNILAKSILVEFIKST